MTRAILLIFVFVSQAAMAQSKSKGQYICHMAVGRALFSGEGKTKELAMDEAFGNCMKGCQKAGYSESAANIACITAEERNSFCKKKK